MNRQPSRQSQDELPDDTPSIEESFKEWLSRHGKQAGWLVAGAVLLLLAFTTYRGNSHRKTLQQTTLARQLLVQAKAGERKATLEELEAVVTGTPSLSHQYGSLLAHLALQQRWSAASADNVEQRERLQHLFASTPLTTNTKDEQRLRSYATTSFTIANGDYSRALKESLVLRDLLAAEDSSHQPLLRLFLQLRLCSLHHALGDHQAATIEWNRLLEQREENEKSFTTFAQHLKEGSLSIEQLPLFATTAQ